MSDESTRALDRTEGGHQSQDEKTSERAWRNLTRSVRDLAVSCGPSVVLNLLLAVSKLRLSRELVGDLGGVTTPVGLFALGQQPGHLAI